MAVVGNNTTPSFGDMHVGLNVQNQVWSTFTMPSPGGLLSDVWCFFDVEQSGPATAYACVWGPTGVLVAYTSIASVPNGNNTTGNEAWRGGNFTTVNGGDSTTAVGSTLFVPSGTSISIGANASQSNGLDVSFASSGASAWGTLSSPVPGNATSGSSTGNGNIGAYCDYTPGGGAYVNTGTPASPTWTLGLAYVNTGTPGSPTWTQGITYVNTGTPGSPVWTPGG